MDRNLYSHFPPSEREDWFLKISKILLQCTNPSEACDKLQRFLDLKKNEMDQTAIKKDTLFKKNIISEYVFLSDIVQLFQGEFFHDAYPKESSLREWFILEHQNISLKKVPVNLREFEKLVELLYSLQQKYEVKLKVPEKHRFRDHEYINEILLKEFYAKHSLCFPN